MNNRKNIIKKWDDGTMVKRNKMGYNKDKVRKVLQLTESGKIIKEWNSLQQAANVLGLNPGSIWRVCNGLRKTHGGYRWVYKDEYNGGDKKLFESREVLEELLSKVIRDARLERKTSKENKDIKKYLIENHQIFEGDIQSWLDDPENELPKLDLRVLFLICEQVYQKTGVQEINPTRFFTKAEIKEARQYSGILEIKEKEMDFPITLPNVMVIGNSAFITTVDIKLIDKLLQNNLLNYNYDLQREATIIKRKDKIIVEPTLNKKNVEEIKDHLLKGTLVPTVLVFNAATRTAESGSELIYDPRKYELTITKGTRLDIVDGFHRIKGSQNALRINPELSFSFGVIITNYSTKRAQQYQAQLAKATPISKVRIQQLEANRLADTVVQQLQDESDLQGRISQTNRVHRIGNELVTYNVLADTIEEVFNMETRADAADVGDYLVDFFNYLLDGFKEEFIDNPDKYRKTSLINDNNMFVGYIVLASRMFEKGIKPRKVVNIIRNIDFSKDNTLWQHLGVLDENKKINTVKARQALKKYFSEIPLDT